MNPFGSDTFKPSQLNILIQAELLQRGYVPGLPPNVHRGMSRHHVESMNNLYDYGIRDIIKDGFHLRKNVKDFYRGDDPDAKLIEEVVFEVTFTDVSVGKPESSGYSKGLTLPNTARQQGRTYSAPIYLTAKLKAEAIYKEGTGRPKKTIEVENEKTTIRSMHICVGSNRCHTQNMTSEQRLQYFEDNLDFGGYFIIRGYDWAISCIDTNPYNMPRIYRNFGHRNEMARLEAICKPGDGYQNSTQVIITIQTDGAIMLSLGVTEFGGKKGIWIPVHIIYRLLGCAIDQDILDSVGYAEPPSGGADGPQTNKLVRDYLVQAMANAMRAPGGEFESIRDIRGPELREEFVKILDDYNNKSYKPGDKSKSSRDYLMAKLDKILNSSLLPHVGIDNDSRPAKWRNLGRMIRQLLLTELGVLEQTDRDNLSRKRVHAAGNALAKTFKKIFNKTQTTVIQKLAKAFKDTPFDQMKTTMGAVYQAAINDKQSQDLEKKLSSEIQKSKNDDKKNATKSHIATEQLARKNNLNYDAALRVIRTTQKSMGTTRNVQIRQVHPSFALYIDPIQSADTGEQVGRVREMAITASVTSSGNSALIETLLKNEPKSIDGSSRLFIPMNRLPNHVLNYINCAAVFVNGRWIGATLEAPRLVRRLVEYRRGYRVDGEAKPTTKMLYPVDKFVKVQVEPRIERTTSISWDTDTNEIHIWCDSSRLIAPLLVVRNNGPLDTIGQEYWKERGFPPYDPVKNPEPGKPGCFVQDILLNNEHLNGLLKSRWGDADMTIDKLYRMGIIEYLSPDETETMLVAQNLETLIEHRYDPTHQYTHLQIPASLLGLPALTAPYADHDQAPRLIFQTNQGKQTCGIPGRNYPFRMDKHSSLQLQNDMPIVFTIANQLTRSNGRNAIVAVISIDGYNQEDSLIGNESSNDRGLFRVYHTNFERKELGQKEQLGIPKLAGKSATRKTNTNFNSLEKETNLVRVGHKLKKNDAMIGIVHRDSDEMNLSDSTVKYESHEPAIVSWHDISKTAEANTVVKVATISTRKSGIGQKFCRLPTAKALTQRGWVQLDRVTVKDYVCSLVDGKIEYVPVLKIHKYEVNEELYRFANGHVEMICTDGHRIYGIVSEREANELSRSPRFNPTPQVHKESSEIITSARARLDLMKTTPVQQKPQQRAMMDRSMGPLDMDDTGELMVATQVVDSLKSGKVLKYLTGGELRRPTVANIMGISADHYMQLISLFLPYGNLLNETVTFSLGVLPKELTKSQKDQISNLYSRLKGLCDAQRWMLLGDAPFTKPDQTLAWHIYNKTVSEELVKYIKYPSVEARAILSRHEQKRLTPVLLSLNSEQAKKFIGMLFTSNRYVTSSRELAEDLQIMIIHAGMSSRIRIAQPDLYEIVLSAATSTQELDISHVSKVRHTGWVYCLEVAPSHIYMVRESDTSVPFWDGNSSRHGQKGMMGMVRKHSQMPFTKSGLVPDLILSPHALPSRMTISQWFEALVAKIGVITGQFFDGTAFNSVDVWDIAGQLKKLGMDYFGREVMYDGNGDRIDAQIFIAPVFYQRLQKYVEDELYWISTGPTNVITRQPLEGRSQNGGLRVGEMEHDVIMSHGTSWAIIEKFLDHSDGTNIYVCRCGEDAVVNEVKGYKHCPACAEAGRDPDIYLVQTSRATLTFLQELQTAGVGNRKELEPLRFEA